MLRRLPCLLLLLSMALALLSVRPAQAQTDPRYFSETRYRVSEDRFWEFFLRRGGVRTFGFPISGTFTLYGQKVQIFQRQVMQLRPDGSVALLNLLDEGLMPYTKINGSTFPAPDPEIVKNAPQVGEKDYHVKALQFVKEHAPEVWQGQQVNFYSTFMNTVRFEDAFPDGKADRSLLPGIDLEVWGLPTSKPTPDPANGGFVYQRFQRGIMHFDTSCGCTQGLLLGMYLKSMMTLTELPPDLAGQAKGSPLYGQYKAEAQNKLARPKDLPGSDLSQAFQRSPIVVVDAGHGGKEIGSSYTFPDGFVLMEKMLTLKVSLRLIELLSEAGYSAVPTRTTDRAVNEPPRDLTGDDKITTADDLQARVDIANNAGGDLLLSVHFNGAPNPSAKGSQMFYSDGRPQTERSKAFAELANTSVLKALAAAGYQTTDRKASTDSSILGGNSHFYLLGPASDTIKRPSNMPAIIGEALYLTNADDANALRGEHILEALARGYRDAINQYFARFPAL